MSINGETVQPIGPGAARVASATTPGHWYEVDLHEEVSCQCRGFEIRGDCRHVKLVEAWDGRWDQANADQATRLSMIAGLKLETLTLATARYQDGDLIIASGLAPVRTTQGNPRFKLKYELAGKVMELAPPRWLLKEEGDAFTVPYRKHLELVGALAIGDALKRIIEASGCPGAVLLCFEDVTKGELCHRSVFSSWWQEVVGVEVPELALMGTGPTVQQTLV